MIKLHQKYGSQELISNVHTIKKGWHTEWIFKENLHVTHSEYTMSNYRISRLFMNLVTKSAIDFTAPAVLPNGDIIDDFRLSKYIEDKYAVLFFYPLDFTFVCPTEIISFSNKINDFSKRGVEVIGISIDSKFSHHHWRKTQVNDGGIGDISYPLVSDIKKSISRDYGVLHDESIALRATFVIDDKFIVRHQSINDLPLGRNIDEFVRIVDAIKHHKTYGEVCPAGWRKGKQAMQASDEGVADYLNSHSEGL